MVRKASPGRWLYVTALLIFFVGVLVAAVLVVSSVVHFRSVKHSFIHIVAPGTTTVHLGDTGSYTIYYEYASDVEGQSVPADQTPPNMIVTITSVATGDTVDVVSADSGTYSLDSSSGIAIMNFNIEKTGDYKITSQYSDGSTGGDVEFAIAHGIARNIVWGIGSILGSIGVFCSATFFAFLLTVIVFILRQRKPTVIGPTGM
ncbi:MAG TPA: hypothetical protein VHV31_00410 [Nitrolancea sp.]|nr:hypothetical protein [Nitrolancea sp.]